MVDIQSATAELRIERRRYSGLATATLTRRRNKLLLVILLIHKTRGRVFKRATSLVIVDGLSVPQELPPPSAAPQE